MKNLSTILLSFLFLSVWQTNAAGQTLTGHVVPEIRMIKQAPDISGFPSPKSGQIQHVINLPPRGRNVNHRLGLIVGKWMDTDGVNTANLTGELSQKTLEGWGYTYYELEREPQAISSLVGVLGPQRTVRKFVSLPEKLIPYVPGTPIIIYTPENYVVQYRTYTAGPTQNAQVRQQPNTHTTHPENGRVETLRFEVGPYRMNCQGMVPQTCLVVNGQYFYDKVEGFTHKHGTVSVIEIERRQICNPNVFNSCPQDVGIYKYRLKHVLSERRVR